MTEERTENSEHLALEDLQPKMKLQGVVKRTHLHGAVVQGGGLRARGVRGGPGVGEDPQGRDPPASRVRMSLRAVHNAIVFPSLPLRGVGRPDRVPRNPF